MQSRILVDNPLCGTTQKEDSLVPAPPSSEVSASKKSLLPDALLRASLADFVKEYLPIAIYHSVVSLGYFAKSPIR